MRIARIASDFIEFNGGWVLQPSALLTAPLASLAIACLFSGAGFSLTRLVGFSLLSVATAQCVRLGCRREQVIVRPLSRQLHWQGKLVSITDDFYLELNQGDLSESEAARFPVELHVVDRSGRRHVLLRSTLAPLLNDLRRLREHLPMAVAVGPLMPDTLHQILTEKCAVPIEAGFDGGYSLTRLHENQLGLAGIFGAIASVAFVVVGFLVTGQMRRFGDISGLGLSLGALLIAIPAIIAVHVGLGLVRVSFKRDALRIEVRRGITGSMITNIPNAELQGAWLIDGPGGYRQLLLRCNDSYRSFPIDGSTSSNLRARFERTGWHRLAD